MEVVLWALLTGGITGGIWTAIVLKGRQCRLAEDYEASTERLVIETRHRDALPPPS